MTKLLDEAIAELQALSELEQNWAAENIQWIMRERERSSGYQLTPEQQEEVQRTLDGLRDGTVRILSDQEIEEMWRRLGA